MGTNYYWIKGKSEPCEHCGRFDFEKKLHIGKSSAGWRFGFHAIPPEDDAPFAMSWKDWKNIFTTTVGYIEDEYHKKIEVRAFIDMVESKQRDATMKSHVQIYKNHEHYRLGPDRLFLDPEGYDFQTGLFS